MQLLQNWDDVERRGPGHNMGCSILYSLKFVKELVRETREKGVAKMQEGRNE